ncbi:hypothetical protein Fmac_028935 [Flemingia macrophylla]|uniref:GATA-type domain-containing protein n=1 Tax=Flemingia macrophylla TaxID=520843 RepID=A0ABD1L900_9FABA
MDLHGSISTPSDFLHIDDFLDLSNIITTTDHLPPPPFHNFFNFPPLPSDEVAELEWLPQFVNDDATSFHQFPSTGSQTTPFLSKNSYNHRNDSNDPKASSSGSTVAVEGGVRRCSHCASEKTPQWRSGPMGPKTLCNACGVRFKSGRLVPEYRPAASPTFVLTQHSNSHRKVMELRRQKELLRQQQEQRHRHAHNFKVC